MSKSHLSRRQFMNRSLAAAGVGAGFAIGGTKSSGRVIGANDTVRIAVAGLNGRGGAHVGEFAAMPGVEIIYLVDPDTRTYARSGSTQIATSKAASRGMPATVQDIRRVLDDKTVDAISVATPNHWHSLHDDLGLPGRQGRLRRKAVQPQRSRRPDRRRGRPASTTGSSSTARRAAPSRDWAVAVAAIQSGKLGKLLVSRALCYKPRGSIGVKPITTPPAAARFQHLARPGARAAVSRQPGPLQLALVLGFRQRRHRQPGRPPDGHRPLADPRLERRQRDLPQDRCISLGGRFGYNDQGQTANTQIASWTTATPSSSSRSAACKTGDFHGAEGRQHRPPRSRDDRRRQVLPQGEDRSRCRSRSWSRSTSIAGRARATSATSSPPCAAARSRT